MEPRVQAGDYKAARRILEGSIADGLRQVLGQSGVEMISSLKPIDVFAADPRKLHALLVSIFGEEGTVVIEKEIAKRLLGRIDEGEKPNADAPHGEKKRYGDLEYEKRVIRRFAEIAELPGGHSKKSARGSIDSTAERFAEAFTK